MSSLIFQVLIAACMFCSVFMNLLPPEVAAMDLDEVFNLCQAREFHSFRRKVCSLNKRSVGPGEYAEYLRETGENITEKNTPHEEISFKRLRRSWRFPDSNKQRTNVPFHNFHFEQQEPHLHPKLTVGLKSLHVPPVDLKHGKMNGIRTNITDFMHTKNHHTRYDDSPILRNMLRDVIGFRLLDDEGSPSFTPLHGSNSTGGQIPHFSLYDHNEDFTGTIPELDIPIAHSDDYHTIYDPRDIYGYNVDPEPSEGGASYNSNWARNDMLLPERKRTDYMGTTVGELRKQCCMYGCTLNKHYFHFLSTCMTEN